MSEYDAAFMKFVWECVDPLMKAIDPVYAQIPHARSSVLTADPTRMADGTEVPVAEPVKVWTDLIMSYERAVAGDLTEVVEIAEKAAHDALNQLMPAFYQLIDQVTEATGNVVQANGAITYDVLLDVLEKVHISEFDDAGEPKNISLIVNPATARAIKELPPSTAEQDARYRQIMQRKREEVDAGRRHRQVPGDGD